MTTIQKVLQEKKDKIENKLMKKARNVVVTISVIFIFAMSITLTLHTPTTSKIETIFFFLFMILVTSLYTVVIGGLTWLKYVEWLEKNHVKYQICKTLLEIEKQEETEK